MEGGKLELEELREIRTCILVLLSTQEEAAEAYDIEAIEFRGTSAIRRFKNMPKLKLDCRELAKWSPNDTKPTMVKNSSEPLLATTNGASLQDTSPIETALTLHDFDRGSDENGGDCAGWNRIS
ncbi:AP2-like ethylene-responsive transcription factor AIL1 [Artemisia annua]|uniref:AP2-like ethylene-responsive transcription factor AIL1 n=1 Tax=Artemisia annua TaxID=35608 RepID=A0A2U1MTA4_ARTAN|nr:AP2-like ethylene-responsive transcription factor AIL1 [Artemisia annua]